MDTNRNKYDMSRKLWQRGASAAVGGELKIKNEELRIGVGNSPAPSGRGNSGTRSSRLHAAGLSELSP